MKIGDRIYCKPWNCLLDNTRDTEGYDEPWEYDWCADGIHTIRYIYSNNDEINLDKSGWDYHKIIIDFNRKVI